MNKATARAFPFEHGMCYLYPDRIEVRKPGISGWIDRYLYSRGVARLAWFNGWLLGGAIVGALVMIVIENFFLAIFLLGTAGVMAWLTIRSWPQSFAPVIERERILSVEWREAIEGVSRAMVVIWFEWHGQKLVQTLRFPRTVRGGVELAREARKQLMDEGLI